MKRTKTGDSWSNHKKIRLERKLTQDQLRELIGVKKFPISIIENSFTDGKFDKLLKAFKALNSKINFKVKL